MQNRRHDHSLPVLTVVPVAIVHNAQRVAHFVAGGKGDAQARILVDRARPGRLTHSSDIRIAKGGTFRMVRANANVDPGEKDRMVRSRSQIVLLRKLALVIAKAAQSQAGVVVNVEAIFVHQKHVMDAQLQPSANRRITRENICSSYITQVY